MPDRRPWSWSVPIAAITTAGVLGVGMTISYFSLIALARAAGIQPGLAWLYPFSIDGLVVDGVVAALALRAAPLRTRLYVWSIVAAGTLASLGGNALHSTSRDGVVVLPPLLAAAASAVPAAAMAVTLHLLVSLVRRRSRGPEAGIDVTKAQPSTRPPGAGRGPSSPALRVERVRRGRSLEAGVVAARLVAQALSEGRDPRSVTDRQLLDQGIQVSPGHARRLLARARAELGESQIAARLDESA